MKTYLVLFRGINVGKANRISMQELKKLAQSIGLKNVKIYLQSGNLIFDTDLDKNIASEKLCAIIKSELGLDINLCILNKNEFNFIYDSLPFSIEEIRNAQDEAPFETLYVYFISSELSAGDLYLLEDYPDLAYQFKVTGNAAYLLCSKSIKFMNTKKDYKHVFNALTSRNWKTAKRIYEILN